MPPHSSAHQAGFNLLPRQQLSELSPGGGGGRLSIPSPTKLTREEEGRCPRMRLMRGEITITTLCTSNVHLYFCKGGMKREKRVG